MASRSLFTNAASLVAGRILLSVGRFAAMVLVARFAGVEAYGAYAILLAAVFLCEWLADFGQTDIAVRDASQSGHTGAVTALARLKWITGPTAAFALIIFPFLAGYPRAMIEAAFAGAVCVLVAAAIQPARARLRLAGRQQIDVFAELLGLVATLPTLALLLTLKQPLWTLVAAFSLGRLVQGAVLALNVRLTGPRDPLQTSLSDLARSAIPLGVIGLVVLAYELTAPVVLSKLMTLQDVGYFMAAFRLVAPTIMVAQATAQAFFPLLSARWNGDLREFISSQNAVIYVSSLMASLMAAAAFGGAEMLMGLFGPHFQDFAFILQIFSAVVFLRALNAVMSPLIVISDRQATALWLALAAWALQMVMLVALVPDYGLVGAALGYLCVELVISTFATWAYASRAAKASFDWTVPLRFSVALVLSVTVLTLTDMGAGFAGFVLCPALTLIFAAMLGLATPARLSALKAVLSMRAAAT